jgi:cytochrome b6-f complex iron-sulfur subunit
VGQNRREFIQKALYGILALLGLGYLFSGLAVLAPTRSRDKDLAFFPLVPEEQVPRLGVKKAELAYTVAGKERRTRVFIVSSPGDIAVLSATCSHLGCLVNYQREKKEFLCPCHGGRYDLTGRNIAGPPPAPLARFPARIEKGTLMVGVKV